MAAKVVHLITRLDLGGAQGNTLYTVDHLDPARWEAVLVCGEGGALDAEPRRARTVFLSSLVHPVAPLHDLLCLLELASFFLREKPAVVHTHSSKAGILGRFAAALAGVPVVVHTYHGFGFHDRQGPLTKGLFVLLERLAARLSTVSVFVSESNRAYAVRHGLVKEGEGELIRSGVRLSDYPAKADKAKLKTAAGIGMHKPLVVSVGNLKPQKNAADFVALAAKVSAAVPEARFVFIGDGPQRRALEAKAFALGLEGRLLFLGWRRDTAQWLAAADAFVMTSLWEGLPRSLVEAMKTGLPCLCYATDGVTDLLRDGVNGMMVPAGDADALAARLTRVLQDPELAARLGRAAAASIGPEFDIDGMVRAQEELYARLLAGRG
ncbi:MAG: glycosyltransferase family 4 protein [Elusimicrobiota bacterium]|nr:glycosyltransferase family 4 protein [Elusimicrobiota bacterium]